MSHGTNKIFSRTNALTSNYAYKTSAKEKCHTEKNVTGVICKLNNPLYRNST